MLSVQDRNIIGEEGHRKPRIKNLMKIDTAAIHGGHISKMNRKEAKNDPWSAVLKTLALCGCRLPNI